MKVNKNKNKKNKKQKFSKTINVHLKICFYFLRYLNILYILIQDLITLPIFFYLDLSKNLRNNLYILIADLIFLPSNYYCLNY